MLSHISLAALGMALTLVINSPALAASGKGGSTKKAAKEQQKNRIELIAKMKQAEVNDEDVAENEASLKYRSRDGKIKLTAEIEGFSDGDIFNMYVVIESQEVLVAKMELISDGDIARQEIEFDEATWPVGIPLVLNIGTAVKVRSEAGALVLEGSLQNK